MNIIEDMMSELEDIGVIGNKVKLKAVPPLEVDTEETESTIEESDDPAEVEADAALADAEESEEGADEEVSEVEGPQETDAQLRARLVTLSEKADQKLAAVIEAVSDLRSVFQELNEAARGEPHEAISEEA